MQRIISLIAQGKSRKTIAQEMSLSVNTVRSYLYKAYDRLGVHNAPEAVYLAGQLGLL
jgi:DNA-binding NarL/FixJ family response regulator